MLCHNTTICVVHSWNDACLSIVPVLRGGNGSVIVSGCSGDRQQRQQQEKEGHRDRPEELLQEVTESESEHCGHAILPVTSQRYVCPEDLDASPADSLEGSPVHCSPSGRDDDKSRKSEPEDSFSPFVPRHVELDLFSRLVMCQDLVARFENDFAQHLKKRNRHKKLQFGAAGAALASGSTAAAAGVGVVVGGAVVVAASPLLLPGLAVAAVHGPQHTANSTPRSDSSDNSVTTKSLPWSMCFCTL